MVVIMIIIQEIIIGVVFRYDNGQSHPGLGLVLSYKVERLIKSERGKNKNGSEIGVCYCGVDVLPLNHIAIQPNSHNQKSPPSNYGTSGSCLEKVTNGVPEITLLFPRIISHSIAIATKIHGAATTGI